MNLYNRIILVLGIGLMCTLMLACTTSEVRYCGKQAGYGDLTCGPPVSGSNWRTVNR